MKNIISILFVFMTLFPMSKIFSQEERGNIRDGNANYKNKKYDAAEVDYLKAIDKKSDSFEATFNLGDALYKQDKFEEAIKNFNILLNTEKDKQRLSNVYHNIGNCYLKLNKLDDAISAYKNALKNDPGDYETKYNLAFAQKMKNQQSQQNQQNQQNKQDQQKQDQQKQDQQKQDQQEQKDQQNQQDQQNKNQQDNKENKPDENKISKEDAERMLDAMQNDEKETQDKINKAKKVKVQGYRIEKDW